MKEIFPDMEVDYATIPDFGDNDSWFNYIITNLPPFEAIASGNDRTKDIFASRGYEIVSLTIRKLVKASNIRKFIKDNTREKCTDLVPAEALAVLKGYKFTERLRTICPPEKKKLIVQISVKHYEEEKVIELDPDKSITEHIQSLFDTNNTEILARGVTEHIDEYEHTITLHYSL